MSKAKLIIGKLKKKSLTVEEALKNPVKKNEKKEVAFQSAQILFLITLAVLSIIIAGVYVGYVNYHTGQAGSIYSMNMVFKRPAYNWAAVYGASFGVGVVQNWEFNISPGSMNEENMFFECFEIGIPHEIYASTVPLDQLDYSSFQPATIQDINNFLGVSSDSYESADYTFTTTTSIMFGSQLIGNIPATYTYVGTGSEQTAFDIGAIKDGNGNIIMVSTVYENLTRGFNDRFYNFQMLLPMRNNESTMYYMFSDPNDVCLGGTETPQQRGLVQGNVTDITGNPIEDVIVVIAIDSAITNSVGFYNLTAVTGTWNIFAIKTGYKVYRSEINVSPNNITYHNIILEIDEPPNPFTGVGPGFGPGVDDPGTGVGPGEVPYQIEQPRVIEGQDFIIALNEINKKMRVGEFSQESIYVLSFKQGSTEINVELQGDIQKFTIIDKTRLMIPSRGDGSFLVTFFANQTPGIYTGKVNISGGINAEIPVTIEILPRDMLQVQALLISLTPQNKKLYAGSTLTFRTDLTNLLTDQQYPVRLLYTLQNMEGSETYWTYNTNVFLKTSLSIISNVELPSDIKTGDYVIRVTASYLDFTSSSSMTFPVELPFYMILLFGKFRVWHLIILLLLLLLAGLAYYYIRKNIEAKKKYHLKVEMSEMPREGPRTIVVGKIAETQFKALMNLENFKTHTIVAGSTGGGKSFSAQVLIEEMLNKDVAVIVFDPTAQWTGMLRKLTNKGLLSLYPNFGMKEQDAKAFKGNIRQIDNSRELIDIRDYMKPGEIQVFACHKLDPKEMDFFVANTVRQVFKANFDESEPLRLMLVYDEVHRLLPKFGGSGEGFLQIERACREFRKWGIGVMLISQVLADFVGQIKANINTEIQMRTRDEGDLERIKTKYGGDVLQSLVKASVGTGMVQNSAYNRGRPYFVTFRPILHSVARLSDEEIEQYNEYNNKIDQITYELNQLEELKQDVFDLKLELKLALDKIKAGNFNMGKIYIEGIEPRVKKFWDKMGKQPKKLERKMVSEEEMKAELEKAKQDRAQFEKDNPVKSTESGDKKEDAASKFKKDVSPEKILKLHNDMLVVNPTSLYSEIEAMKDSDYEYHVNENKNDFADWIKDAVGDIELAALMEQETDRKKIMELLDMRQKGQKLPKLEIKKQPKSDENKSDENKSGQQKTSENKSEVINESKKEIKTEKKQINDEENQKDKFETDDPKKVFEELATEPPAEIKEKVIRKNQQINFDKEAPMDKYFRLENGVQLKSIGELKDYIPKMPDDVFRNHVNNDRNDFANWIKYVFHEDELADKIGTATSKESLEEVLSNA